ncbi:hypothetical protein GN157_06035 [Flavobacterium rakeshii]|uniref:Repeat protein (TIGR03806 family) n=1 Tax=Flavobacterium rakeshii TaxID=1038845 RepID=A0A6N8H9M8_9FLAO|nr:hypothetical protein [Flavobacterium rakeshii]MEE1897183.1 hypothetical protein [Flavobacterium rakeshii]MUV03264.1 hypothetical protein [Flavobacterium rakeshii]
MKKQYFLSLAIVSLLLSFFISCGSDDSDNYSEIPEESPVVFDITTVPYPKLSDYNFFEGDMKNLEPVYGVLPYDLNSSLFTDYALKKRFVWMPDNTPASYTSDGAVLDFPTGTILIKNFYYENVGAENVTRILESRLLIKKQSGWIFANYVWNGDQTEAYLDMEGSTVRMSWNHNGTTKTINYKIPSEADCALCHTFNEQSSPIGPKPQNLNKAYHYNEGVKNQITKWIETGYLNSAPSQITSTVNWKDNTQPLELRVRSYLDINCAHCHTEGTYCGYTPMNFAFNQTSDPINLGICIPPSDFATNGEPYLISGQNIEESLIYFRMNNNIPTEMMPLRGRTIVDQEALLMMKEWINSLETSCP